MSLTKSLDMPSVKRGVLRAVLFLASVYALLFMLFCIYQPMVSPEEMKKIAMAEISASLPASWEYLVDVVDDRKPYDKRILAKVLRCYSRLERKFPGEPEVLGLLGFCHYHTGHHARAMDFYTRAIAAAPDFFWFYHNLALIQFKTGAYARAKVTAQQALKLDMQRTVDRMQKASPLYPRRLFVRMFSDGVGGAAGFFNAGQGRMVYVARESDRRERGEDGRPSEVPLKLAVF